MPWWTAKTILWIIAGFYAYGALVHVLNIAVFGGFDWLRAPMKWQVLDIVYLVLDATVSVGFLRGWQIGFMAFYVAALSQIALYTVFRSWITDVPAEFMRTPDQIEYLNGLVLLHVITIILVSVCLYSARRVHTGQQRTQ